LNKRAKKNHQLLLRAGFKKEYDEHSYSVYGCGDIRISVGDAPLSLERLIQYVIAQAVYQDRKKTRVVHEGFKVNNKITNNEVSV